MNPDTTTRRRFHLRPLLPLMLILGAGSALAVPQVGSLAMFTSHATSADNSVLSGSGGIAFVDGTGAVSTAAAITVTNAQPEMSPKVATFTVKNTGTVAEAVTISSDNLRDLAEPSLDDVLHLVITDATGNSLYTGKVSNLSAATLGELAASASKVLTFTITWPTTLADNDYQGNQFTFDIVTDAESVGH